MTAKEIVTLIQTAQEKFKQPLSCNPTYAKSIPDVIALIECYTNSKYRNNAYEGNWRKPFLNIEEVVRFSTSKSIDVDTKNFQVINEDWQSWVGAYILDRELKFWMKEKRFGRLLNEGLVYPLPKYGHIVWKKVKGEIYNVPIGNLIFDPKAKSILRSRILIEKHDDWTEADLSKYDPAKSKIIVDAYEKLEKPIEGFEVYYKGEFYIVAGLDINEPQILYTSKVDIKDLYKEQKFEDVVGRALGRGQVERLFEAQIAQNESFGYLMKGLKWSSMHAWQTRDQNVKGNLGSEIQDGEIVTALSEINPIAMEERNLGAYRYIDTLLSTSIQARTFTQDVVRGDRPPAGTPLGTTQLQAAMSGGYFDIKREDNGFLLKEVVEDWILPEFKKQNKKAKKIHLMKLLGEAAGDKIFNAIVDNRVRQRQLDMAPQKLVGGKELEMLTATIAETLKRSDMDLPENFYDDLNYKIDVVITAEQIDLSSKITTLQVVLQILGSNPTIMQDKNTKRIFFKLLDWAGISPESIMTEDSPSMQNIVAQRGGSVAMPNQPTQPQMISQPI